MALKATRTHGELKNAVMRACNLLPGVFVFPTGVGSFRIGARFVRMGMKGTSDLVGWRQDPNAIRYAPPLQEVTWLLGRLPIFVALEIKTGKDTLRPEQRAFLDKVREAGGIALEVRSVEQAVEALQ